MRGAGAIFWLALLVFCVFGFVAAWEPMEAATAWTWRIVYTVVGVVCLAMIMRTMRRHS